MTTVDFDKFTRDLERVFQSGGASLGADARADAGSPRFEFEPKPLDIWLRDPQMLGTVDLSPPQFDALRHAERVLYPETFDALGWEPVRSVLEINLAWGKGPLAYDTPILTGDGWKKHGDLAVGDQVRAYDWYDHSESWSRVTDVKPTVHEDCYRISWSNLQDRPSGDSIVATAGHRWPIEVYADDAGTLRLVEKRTDQVKVGDRYRAWSWFDDDPVWEQDEAEQVYVTAIEQAESVPANCITIDHPSHVYRVGRTGILTCNSGKDFLSRIILSRALYLLLSLENPQGYFGMPSTETIAVTNIATAAPQAKNAFFDPWVRMLEASPFFSDRMDFRAREIMVEKGLLAISGHSSIESQEGQNLLVAVLDEIAAFKTAQELDAKRRKQDREPEQSAEGIHRMAKSSVTSRFPETGKVVALSFTRFKNDAIDMLVNRSEMDYELLGVESRKFSSRAATWEVNPLRSRRDFDEQYRDDAADAQCRYECRPMASPHRFFKNLLAVRQVMGAPLNGVGLETMPAKHTVGIEYVYGPDPDDPTLPDSWHAQFDFTGIEQHRDLLAIHMDIGISHDLAGVAASHVSGWKDVTTEFLDDAGEMHERTVRKPEVVTDFVVAFEQVPGDVERDIPPSDIQIRWIRKLILELVARGWVVGTVTADGYQSTDSLQLLEQQGIETALYSLDRTTEGYDTLKSMIEGQEITIPWHPLLYAEIESLTKVAANKIDHQAGGSKDMADALAGSVRGAVLLAEASGQGDTWTGGTFEETVRAEAQRAEVANALGHMMTPTMTKKMVDSDSDFGGVGDAETELDRQRFEDAGVMDFFRPHDGVGSGRDFFHD